MQELTLDQEFLNVLQGEDELGVVIRTHIHIEASLNALLSNLMKEKKEFNEARLTYAQKVRLACALALNAKHANSLLMFGKIRNKFAHRLDETLNAELVKPLFESFSVEDRQRFNKDIFSELSEYSKDGAKNFQSLDPKDQFILMAVNIKAMLVVAVTMTSQLQI